LYERLARHWGNDPSVFFEETVSETGLANLEKRIGSVLPSGLRFILREVTDGFEDCDANGFRFLSAQELFPIRNTYEEMAEEIEHPLIFAEYLTWCWAYAVDLATESGVVYIVGLQEGLKQVAASFDDFLELYLVDDSTLYPP